MKSEYRITRLQVPVNPALVELIRVHAAFGTMSVQDIIDVCAQAGFDGRATAAEIGMLLMDKELRPRIPTDRLCGSTVVEIANG